MIFKTLLVTFGFLSGLFSAKWASAVTITPIYYGTYDETTSPPTLYYPITGAGSCATPVTHTLGALDSTATPTFDNGPALRFYISNTKSLETINHGTAPTLPTEVSIRVEKDNATPVGLISFSHGYNNAADPYEVSYGTTSGSAVLFGIALRQDPTGDGVRTGLGFCEIFDAVNLCQRTPTLGYLSATVTIGLVQKNGNFSDADSDKTTFRIVLAACPPGATSDPFSAPNLNFSVQPGDGLVKISNNTSQPYDQLGLKSLLAIGTPSGLPVPYTGAVKKEFLARTGSGEYVVDNLRNNQEYCFSLSYVNLAGIATAGDSTGATWSTTMPGQLPSSRQCATPSSIQGFLDRSTCFIASAVYKSEFDPRLEVFRQFRDQVLLRAPFGERIEAWYYDWGPSAANWLRQHPILRNMVELSFVPVYWGARAALAFDTFWRQVR